MAYSATFTTTPAASAWSLVKRPFQAYFNLMIRIAEAGPQMAAIRTLNAATDADLTARGTTREREVRRIFGARFYL